MHMKPNNFDARGDMITNVRVSLRKELDNMLIEFNQRYKLYNDTLGTLMNNDIRQEQNQPITVEDVVDRRILELNMKNSIIIHNLTNQTYHLAYIWMKV